MNDHLVFEKLARLLFYIKDYDGYCKRDNWCIMITDLKDAPQNERQLQDDIRSVTSKFRLIKTSVYAGIANYNILDIDL